MTDRLITVANSYEAYSHEYGKKRLNKQLYRRVNAEFAKFLIELVLNGEVVRLPCSTGVIGIVGRKTKHKITENGHAYANIDWRRTCEMWKAHPEMRVSKKYVYYTNLHTQGIQYSFTWNRKANKFKNRYLYEFNCRRENKRALYRRIMDGQVYQVREEV